MVGLLFFQICSCQADIAPSYEHITMQEAGIHPLFKLFSAWPFAPIKLEELHSQHTSSILLMKSLWEEKHIGYPNSRNRHWCVAVLGSWSGHFSMFYNIVFGIILKGTFLAFIQAKWPVNLSDKSRSHFSSSNHQWHTFLQNFHLNYKLNFYKSWDTF